MRRTNRISLCESGVAPLFHGTSYPFNCPCPHTAPSKRILKIAASYDKVAEGTVIAADIGVQKIRAECPHFNAWLTQLEQLGV